MDGDIAMIHAAQKHVHRHSRQCPAKSRAGEDESVQAVDSPHRSQFGKDGYGCGIQWNAMFAPGLHPTCRDRPDSFGEVDLIPLGTQDLTGSRCG